MKTYVWTLPTRIFHWMLVLFVSIMFVTSEEENLLRVHAAFGYGVGVLVSFRIVWGIIGPKYSKFSDFPLKAREIVEFLTDIFSGKKVYVGHNPAASLVMLSIVAVLFFAAFSGVLTYGIQEGRGILAFLHSDYFKKMEVFEEIHEFFASLLLFLIFVHIAGVVTDSLLHGKNGALKSIFNGYKNVEGESVKLNAFQKAVAVIFLTAAVSVPIIALSYSTPLTKSVYKPKDYEKRSSFFVEECGSCHTLYPPFLLPKRSWKKLMAGLEDHFGDDASLDKDVKDSIENFLLSNAAETSDKEAAFYILKSLKGKEEIAVTKTPYWKRKHKNIDEKIFLSKKVKSKANCKACHKGVEKGMIEDREISFPGS